MMVHCVKLQCTYIGIFYKVGTIQKRIFGLTLSPALQPKRTTRNKSKCVLRRTKVIIAKQFLIDNANLSIRKRRSYDLLFIFISIQLFINLL